MFRTIKLELERELRLAKKELKKDNLSVEDKNYAWGYRDALERLLDMINKGYIG